MKKPQYTDVHLKEMVSKAISQMKSGKAAGPSGIIVEMIKAAGDGVIALFVLHHSSTI